MRRLQIIQDTKGRPIGVYIPISEWCSLKRKYKNLKELEYEAPSKEILMELKEAVLELQEIEQGKKKACPVSALLGEL